MKTTPAGLILILLGLVLANCSSKPDYVLSENKMADVLAELSIVDQLATQGRRTGSETFSNDSNLKVLRQSIMKKQGVTEAEFDSTLNWYGHHMEEFSQLYKKVDRKLAKRLAKLNKEAGKNSSDAQNLWPLQSMISIGPASPYPGFSWSLSGTRFKPGQDLVWKLHTSAFPGQATAFIGAEYQNQEIQFTRASLLPNRTNELILNLKANGRPTRIIGYVHMPEIPAKIVNLDSLSLTVKPSEPNDGTGRSTHLPPLPKH